MTGVLLVGFGGPDSLDAIEPFMRNLMGREPSTELLERVRGRYLAIGGRSPLTEIATAIAEQIEGRLTEIGYPMPVRVGMAYWQPFIKDAVAELVREGCDRIVTVSLSPFESVVAQQKYRDAVNEAVEAIGGIEIVEAPLVSELDEYSKFYAGATAGALTDLEPNEGAIIVFTAHSLPLSDLTQDDAYVSGLRAVADEVAGLLGCDPGQEDAGFPMFEHFRAFGSAALPRAWYLVYQSKGHKPGEWLEPSIEELVDASIEAKIPAIVCVPIGFMTDHLETLWDLDIVAADRALEGEVEFIRAPVPNDHDWLTHAIAEWIAAN